MVFLSLGSAILYYVFTVQSNQYLEYCTGLGNDAGDCGLIDKILTDVRTADLRWLILTIVLYMLSNVSRAIRWKMLLEAGGESVKTRNTFLATMVGYLANLAIPRLGEFVRASIIARYERVDAAKVMGTVVTDRLLDLLGLLVIFGLGFIFGSRLLIDYLSENATMPVISLGLVLQVLLVLAVLVGLAYFLYNKLKNHPLIVAVKIKLQQFAKGIMSIRKVKNFPLLVLHSINIYLMYFFMTYLPFFSFESTSHLSPLAGLLVFIFGGLGMVLPSPGGMGTYHAMVIAALGIFGVSGPDGFSFAMIIFIVINICVNFLTGIISLIVLPLVNKKYKLKHSNVPSLHTEENN